MTELRRSRTNRIIAGVCGGIGKYLDINANVIRLIWVIATVFTVGIGVLAYLFAWLVIPEEESSAAGSAPAATAASGTDTTSGSSTGPGVGTWTTGTDRSR